ncbi:ulp1 protease family, C-terminal catalytic domain-containing protein [Tanacetum coccineum]
MQTSSIGFDSPLNNVFSDTMEFDHDSVSSFAENPDNRAALMNKITNMEVEFQRRITTIEQYLKIHTSSNVEKTSNVAEECMDVDLNSMYVDRDVKTSCVSYVYAKNMDNDSMDVDHDPKVVEQQYVAGKNLINEFEQQVTSKNFINDEALEEPHVAGKNFIDEEDQQASSKNLEVEEEELFAEMHNQLPTQPMMTEVNVQECNNGETAQSMTTDSQSQDAIHNQLEILSINIVDSVDVNPIVVGPKVVKSVRVPFKREVKLSKYRQSPYMIQPDSTELNHKVRATHNKVKKRCLPLTVLDGKVIPPWTEENKEKFFYFPWANDGSFVYSKFWESFLGIGKERRGWLSDTRLGLWVLYLWYYRPAEADWAIAGPFFNTFMLGKKLSCCYADGVTYDVPWFAQSVEKVYFPINAEDVHWILAELHIRSGVVTFYNSLPPEEGDVEDQKWWLAMRQSYAEEIPKLLL